MWPAPSSTTPNPSPGWSPDHPGARRRRRGRRRGGSRSGSGQQASGSRGSPGLRGVRAKREAECCGRTIRSGTAALRRVAGQRPASSLVNSASTRRGRGSRAGAAGVNGVPADGSDGSVGDVGRMRSSHQDRAITTASRTKGVEALTIGAYLRAARSGMRATPRAADRLPAWGASGTSGIPGAPGSRDAERVRERPRSTTRPVPAPMRRVRPRRSARGDRRCRRRGRHVARRPSRRFPDRWQAAVPARQTR